MSYRTAPAPEPPPPTPCLGCFHPEHRGACPACHSRCLATRACARLPHALLVHAFVLVALGALSETFRPFAMQHVPGVFAIWLLAEWARRRGYGDADDTGDDAGGEATLVRADLGGELRAGDAGEEPEDYTSSRRSAASSRTPA